MYKAIRTFVDGEMGKAWPPAKGGLRYEKGDCYPKEGFAPDDRHIAYLLGNGNRFGEPVIQEIATKTPAPRRPKKGKEGGKNDLSSAGAAQTPPEPDGQ